MLQLQEDTINKIEKMIESYLKSNDKPGHYNCIYKYIEASFRQKCISLDQMDYYLSKLSE